MVKRIAARILGAVGILLVAFLTVASLSPADAAMMTCRADPIVFLSNGDKVQIVASIATRASNVQVIDYALHVPPGVTAIAVLYTGNPFAGKELLTLYNDASSGSYTTDAVVTTRVTGVSVTATTSLVATTALRRLRAIASGYDRQTLSVTLFR